jgi:hypothetical protein
MLTPSERSSLAELAQEDDVTDSGDGSPPHPDRARSEVPEVSPETLFDLELVAVGLVLGFGAGAIVGARHAWRRATEILIDHTMFPLDSRDEWKRVRAKIDRSFADSEEDP